MTKQLLIYEKVVPVSIEQHKDLSIKTGNSFEFAQKVNALPLMAVEFNNAASEYPIVFTSNEDVCMPSVVLGIRNEENLYINEESKWVAKYIPAFVRRYPFVFSSNDDGKTFTLCIDEEFEGCNKEGQGERLFDSEGERTQYLGNVLEFVKQYQSQYLRTQSFCQKIKNLELLEPMQATLTLKAGEQASLSGFMAVNRDKLKALSGETLMDLAKTDELELLFLHLHSMQNFSSMPDNGTGFV